MKLTSAAFSEGERIPPVHTCDGANQSPPLEWHDTPHGVRSFAIIADDPDAPRGTWVHWVLYGLPAATKELPTGLSTSEVLPGGVRQGVNDFGRSGYDGPCPPPGKPHRYYFKLYALSQELKVSPRPTKPQMLRAMEGHILAEAALMGTYERRT
jgi:Raf kinase inhibitor-like YbhB/YbcL family protein